MPASASPRMVVPYGMPTESERGEDESLVLRMAEASSRRACTGAPSCDCWLSMRRMSNKSRREWHHGLVSSERDSASQGATLGASLEDRFCLFNTFNQLHRVFGSPRRSARSPYDGSGRRDKTPSVVSALLAYRRLIPVMPPDRVLNPPVISLSFRSIA